MCPPHNRKDDRNPGERQNIHYPGKKPARTRARTVRLLASKVEKVVVYIFSMCFSMFSYFSIMMLYCT